MDGFVNVLDYVTEATRLDIMAGTLTRDVSEEFGDAIATGRPVYVPNGDGWAYLFSATLTIPSNTTLFGDGALLVLGDGVNSNLLQIESGATNVVIRGLHINGNKANNTAGCGIKMIGEGAGSNISISEMYIYDCVEHGILFSDDLSTSLSASRNRVTGCNAGGITSDYTVKQFSFEENHCWLNGTHGVGILGIGINGAIVGNVCWDNGQGDPRADNLTGYNLSNDNLTVTGNSCSGGGNNGIHFGGSRITLTGNTSYNATEHGIVILVTTSAGNDCIIADNVSYGSGRSGFWLKNCGSGVVTGNIARDNAHYGIWIDNCTNIAVTGNTARGNGYSGIANDGHGSAWLAICGNTSRSNGEHGLYLYEVTDSAITGNVFELNTGWGVNIGTGETRNNFASNIVRSNTAGQIQAVASTTQVLGNVTGLSSNVASAATLTLPPNGDYFYITGTTSITSITANFVGRKVTLQFDDALTVTNGSNLRLSGSFTTTYKDTITLVCDGSNWSEVARAVI